ncbi:MAG: ABC transporter permease [Chloroflexi bacterium]|nr:ABC transporter permease [Chloroflexota bacterium]
MAERTLNAGATRQFASEARHPAIDALIRIVRNPVGGGSAIVLFVLIASAVVAWAGFGGDPYTSLGGRLDSPNRDFLFGTDQIGRDVFARVLQGAVISLYVGFLATGLAGGLGSAVGLLSGFAGGWLDLVIQRVVDALLSIPGLVLALFFAAVFDPSTETGVLAITIAITPAVSRVIRSAVLAAKENVYVEAARTIGATPLRIMVRHVLPNVTAPILIMMSTLLGAAILIEASLAFLGMGAQEPDPSWGVMLRSARQFMEVAPWLVLAPGAAISLTVLAFNLLGDRIRDVLDPRLRGSR